MGVLLIQGFQLIGDQTHRELAISSVPVISVFSGYLIHCCYQYLATDWPLKRMNKQFNKTEARLRRQLKKQGVSEEEKTVINEKLVSIQKLRSDAEISRIQQTIESAPESAS